MNYTSGPGQGLAGQQEALNRQPMNMPIADSPKISNLYQVITASNEALRDCHRVMDRLRDSLVGPEPQAGNQAPAPGPRSIHEAAKEMGELLGTLQQRLHQFEAQL